MPNTIPDFKTTLSWFFFLVVLQQGSTVDVTFLDVSRGDRVWLMGCWNPRTNSLMCPCQVRLCLISGTLVSRTSMLDALEYKINLAGHLEAHNGFSFSRNSLGYATVGSGREPINAWLPLYVTESHWERVKVGPRLSCIRYALCTVSREIWLTPECHNVLYWTSLQ